MSPLSEGEELFVGPWRIEAEAVQDYLSAAEDSLPLYGELGAAPPLMVAANAMRIMLEKLGLPPGAIHTSQDLEFAGLARVGAEVKCLIKLSRDAVRGPMRVMTVDFIVSETGGKPLVKGRSTVMVPQQPAPLRQSPGEGQGRAGGTADK